MNTKKVDFNKNFAKKSLGQHFLHDKNICNKIVDLLEINKNTNVIEIGPGTGALTNIIRELPYQSFTILEKDDRFAQLHTEKNAEYIALNADNFEIKLEVIHTDALKHHWKEISTNVKIISNLPYNIASPLMWDIVSQTPQLERAVFMIQNEVADRCIAKENSKAYGVLSIWLQAYCDVKKNFVVNPGAFSPPPKVDSAVITLIPHPKEKQPQNPHILADLIKICFQQRRKQIEGILKKSKYKNLVEAILTTFDIQKNARPEIISVEKYIQISDFIAKNI